MKSKIISKKLQLPWWKKYTLTIEESTVYFGIGEKKLRQFIMENKNADFIIRNGVKVMIKRKKFEEYLDNEINVI